MKLNLQQLDKHVQGPLAPIYIVAGDEPLLVQQALDQLRSVARQQCFQQRDVFHVERGFDWGDFMQASASLSLFSEKRLLELRLDSGKPGDQGAKMLLQYAQSIADDQLLIVIGKKYDAAVQRSKWFTALSNAGAFVQIWPINKQQLPGWIRQRIQASSMRINDEALSLLVERAEGNLLAAHQEIEKLSLQGLTGEIDVQTLLASVADNARYTIYGLVDASALGQAVRVRKMIAGLRAEGTEPVLMLWALSREIRSLARMAEQVENGNTIDNAMNKERVWQNRKNIVKTALQRHKRRDLYGLLQKCKEIDWMIKGLQAGEVWGELLQLSFAFAGTQLRVERT